MYKKMSVVFGSIVVIAVIWLTCSSLFLGRVSDVPDIAFIQRATGVQFPVTSKLMEGKYDLSKDGFLVARVVVPKGHAHFFWNQPAIQNKTPIEIADLSQRIHLLSSVNSQTIQRYSAISAFGAARNQVIQLLAFDDDQNNLSICIVYEE